MQTGDPQPWHIAWEDTAWTPDELFKARRLPTPLSIYLDCLSASAAITASMQGGMCYFLHICHIMETW